MNLTQDSYITNGCGSMAKFSVDGLNQYEKMIGRLAKDIDKLAHYAVYPAAGMVLQELKARTPVDSGDLRDSEILTDFKDDFDTTFTSIVFAGYDRDGVPNSLKARTLESGRSKQYKHPFIRPTMRAVKQQCIDMISQRTDEYINKKMEE